MPDKIDYRQILINLLVDLSLADHLGDAYQDCKRASELADLLQDYDEEATYFYDDEDGGEQIETYSYDHFSHYLRKEKGGRYLHEIENT